MQNLSRITFVLLFILELTGIGFTSSAMAGTRVCRAAMVPERHSPNSREWKRLSVRDPYDKIIDALYLKRLNESLYAVFQPWFLNGDDRPFSYKDMLARQHKVAATDERGNAYYKGASFREFDFVVPPGKFLYEYDDERTRMGKVWVDYSERVSNPKVARRLTALLQNMSRKVPYSKWPDGLFSYWLTMPRLGDSLDIRNNVDFNDDTIQHRFARYFQHPKILKTLGEIMADLKKIPPGSDPVELLKLLTEYVYLGANTHPFRGGNFSLLMSHVNWILQYHGWRGISHGGIDFEAMYFPYKDFTELFREHIFSENLDFGSRVQPRAPAPRRPRPAESEWASRFPVDSPDWVRLTVRDPSQRLLDAQYPRRAHQSLDLVFIPWFESATIGNGAAFEKMMREQHEVLANGPDGDEVYQGASRRAKNVAEGYVVQGGLFRYDKNDQEHAVSFAFKKSALLPQDMTPDLLMYSSLYSTLSPRPPRESSTVTADPIVLENSVAQVFDIPRVEDGARLWNFVNKDTVTVVYPKNFESYAYLQAMGEIMKEIRQTPRSNRTVDKIVGLLAEYSYLGARAHLANGANFSLAMIQVEYVLDRWGLRGISHSNLDYVALTRTFSEYEHRFRADVIAANAQNAALQGLISKGEPPVLTRSPVSLSVMGHLAQVGDKNFKMGEFIGDFDDPDRVEGFAILDTALPQGVTIEYRGSATSSTKSKWVGLGEFVGTRGQSLALQNLAIRLAGAEADKYEIIYQARVASDEWLVPQKNGAPIVSDSDEPITGLKIWLYKILR